MPHAYQPQNVEMIVKRAEVMGAYYFFSMMGATPFPTGETVGMVVWGCWRPAMPSPAQPWPARGPP